MADDPRNPSVMQVIEQIAAAPLPAGRHPLLSEHPALWGVLVFIVVALGGYYVNAQAYRPINGVFLLFLAGLAGALAMALVENYKLGLRLYASQQLVAAWRGTFINQVVPDLRRDAEVMLDLELEVERAREEIARLREAARSASPAGRAASPLPRP